MTKCKICDNISRENVLAILWNWNSSCDVVKGLGPENWGVVVCFSKKIKRCFSAKLSHRFCCPRSPYLMRIGTFLSGGKGIGAWSWPLTSSWLRVCAAETQLHSRPTHCWRGALLNIGTISDCTSSNATTIIEQCVGKRCGRSDHRLIWHYYRISEIPDENPLGTSVRLPVSSKKFETETSEIWCRTATCSTMTFAGDKEHIDEGV